MTDIERVGVVGCGLMGAVSPKSAREPACR